MADNNKQTIVQKYFAYSDYPFIALDKGVLDLFDQVVPLIAQHKQKRISVVLRTFECFLQITNQQITILTINKASFTRICNEFIGAIYSDHFVYFDADARYAYADVFLCLLNALKTVVPLIKTPCYKVSTIGPTKEICGLVKVFESLPLNDEKRWVWAGWRTENRKGRVVWLQLYPVYERLGRDFTQKLFDVCDTYFRARKAHYVGCAKPLARFIGQHPAELKAQYFLDPVFMSRFWREFFVFYMVNGYANGEGAKISGLTIRWRRHILPFINDHLIASGLFVKPWGELPIPEYKFTPGGNTNIITTASGEKVKTKLITHIPLQLSDEEAIQLLFRQIEADVTTIENWAKREISDIWERYQRRLNLANNGAVCMLQEPCYSGSGDMYLTDRANPDHLQNAAATFQFHGFVPSKVTTSIAHILPKPLRQTALELALPTSLALIPYCTLLISKYPVITEAFLCDLELFDRNGKQIGFASTDAGYKLVGHKDRRGANLAQQIIPLDDYHANLVQQVIKLTQPLRDYLRNCQDDNWRYLFLSCGGGFSYPSRIRRFSYLTSGSAWNEFFSNSLIQTSELSLEQRYSLSERFSLTSLRASAGVLVYLKTHSTEEMAKALGHASYDAGLLSVYLPEPILAFFQERWIRIFQEGIVVQALKESAYLLEASSFKTIEELNEFLKTHAFRSMPLHLENPNYISDVEKTCAMSTTSSEVCFGVNTGILVILLSLQLAVEHAQKQVNALAKYWYGISHRLISHIETNLKDRPDIQGYLVAARDLADPVSMEAMIYG